MTLFGIKEKITKFVGSKNTIFYKLNMEFYCFLLDRMLFRGIE